MEQTDKKTSYVHLRSSTLQSLLDETLGFRMVGDTKSYSRNLPEVDYGRMIDVCYWIWESYPLARWIIEVIVSFIIAEDLPYVAEDEEIKGVLDEFWFDPVNNFDIYLEKHIRELFIYGCILLPVMVSKTNGRVRMGYTDPKQIDKVLTDPTNVKIVLGVQLKALPGEEPIKYKTILPEDIENFISPKGVTIREECTGGFCFYAAINSVTNAPRGLSELRTIADWIDTYEVFLYDYANKWSKLNSFVWDLEVAGGNADIVKEEVENVVKASTSAGGVYGHNDQIKLNPAAPKLNSLEVAEGARLFRNHILGSAGIPVTWYGGGEDANKATAGEMTVPAMKMMSARQKVFKQLLYLIFDFQIEMAYKYGKEQFTKEAGKKRRYKIITPELNQKSLKDFGAVIKNVADGLGAAIGGQFLDKDTAVEAIVVVLNNLGLSITPMEVRERLKVLVLQEPTGGGGNANSKGTSKGRTSNGK